MLVEYSILLSALNSDKPTPAPAPEISSAISDLLERASKESLQADRAIGCFVGNCLADALGHPLEFLDVDDSVPPFPTERPYLDPDNIAEDGTPLYHHPLNTFRLKPGQWTDDFSMAACLADSLLVHRYYSGADARIRWHNWWGHGYNNAFRFDPLRSRRNSCGLGGNISKSIFSLNRYRGHEENVPPYYEGLGEDAGNGSIMRLSPVPIMFHADPALAEEVAAQQSRGTHPGNDAAAACQFMTFFAICAMKDGRPSPADVQATQQLVDTIVKDFIATHNMEQNPGLQKLQRLLLAKEGPASKECCWNWRGERLPITLAMGNRRKEGLYNGYPVIPDYFGSYCLDGLAMALWGLYHSASFEEAVIKVVNLLGDADSTGAVAGQLAGAVYGYSGIRAGGGKAPMWKVESKDADTGGQCTRPLAPGAVPEGRPKFRSMGECWLHHLRRWDPYLEIPLKGLLLFCLDPIPAPPPITKPLRAREADSDESGDDEYRPSKRRSAPTGDDSATEEEQEEEEEEEEGEEDTDAEGIMKVDGSGGP
eukprot:EG_transcript_6131